jgi:hypothetical protein
MTRVARTSSNLPDPTRPDPTVGPMLVLFIKFSYSVNYISASRCTVYITSIRTVYRLEMQLSFRLSLFLSLSLSRYMFRQ